MTRSRMSILVVVESPAKISKISSFLGKNYKVVASYGHFRDLDKKKMSIDFDKNFEPIYVITNPSAAKKLKTAMSGITKVYLATDGDLEGSAIAKSIIDYLKPKEYRRMVFNSITKDAIITALKNAGDINHNEVNAQKTRRVLDRIFGYLISPILQRQIGGSLSAGRVQSPTLRIIVERETEIKNFLEKNKDSSFYKVNGLFSEMKATLFESTDAEPHILQSAYKGKAAHIALDAGDNPDANVVLFLKTCLKSQFEVHSVADRVATRSAAPPFTTSTLQQEANRKFGMSIDSTMKTAQKLYEAGFITYMRTDSVDISPEGHKEIKQVIEKEYGKDYYQKNIYKTKAANAQEAHEAIRPTHPDLLSLEKEIDDAAQIKLYRLIWQRTIASQMKPAKINVTTIQISISKYIEKVIEPYYYFQSQVEKVTFPGFMAVYVESVDDPEEENTTKNFKGKIPKTGDTVVMEEITARQEYMRPPPRFSQASLVKKLEEIGIGRPSTYVNTIKTIMDRDYVKVDDVPGIKKDAMVYTIKSENKKPIMTVFENKTKILLGKESKKLMPTNLGRTVYEFLMEHFIDMMDYKFTANLESEMDDIAAGKKTWHKVVKKFYDKLKPIVDNLAAKTSKPGSNDRLVGKDEDDNEIFATKTKYGPVVKKKMGEKFVYAKIPDSMNIDTITIAQAVKLFAYPKLIGQHEKHDILLQKGQYGLYLVCNKQNYTVPPDIDEKNLDLTKAHEIINAKKSGEIAEFNVKNKAGKKINAVVLEGKFGPYIQTRAGKKRVNYPIPKNLNAKKLTDEQVLEIISTKKTYNKPKGGFKKKTAKKSGSKKAVKN